MTYTDKTIICAECGTPFPFTAGEQAFHAEKGFTNEPRRCPSCRAVKRQQRGDSSSGGASFSSGGSSGGQRELFSATCASCGKEATVPFQPSGDRPVYCSDCFRTQRDSYSSGRAYADRGGRGGNWGGSSDYDDGSSFGSRARQGSRW